MKSSIQKQPLNTRETRACAAGCGAADVIGARRSRSNVIVDVREEPITHVRPPTRDASLRSRSCQYAFTRAPLQQLEHLHLFWRTWTTDSRQWGSRKASCNRELRIEVWALRCL
jgi:hypothetical protein